MVTRSVPTKSRRTDYSDKLPDPPRVPDMMEQMSAIAGFLTMLRAWFRNRGDVFVGVGGYLWKTPYDGHGPYPDGSFAVGIEDVEWLLQRNGYVISEVGKPPDLVFEVGSRSTGRNDYTEKRETYADYGVGEYWRFDHSGGEYHDAPLVGDRLGDEGVYEPIEIVVEPDGRHWGYSEVLGLEFWWVRDESPGWNKGELRFRDPVSGEFLRTYEETQEAMELAEARADFERAALEGESERAAWIESERLARLVAEGRAASAEARAESAHARAASAEARMAEMEAEMRRLRGE